MAHDDRGLPELNQEEEKQEIIIIKRGGGHDDGHHGGAWKIAFADFMTAMMALFLVLWLVNAANEETKKSVASYFNPVKLVDRNRSTKGLDDASGGPANSEEVSEDTASAEPEERVADEQAAEITDAALAEDPYRVLDEIAKGEPTDAQEVEAADAVEVVAEVVLETGAPMAEELQHRDPFAPEFWNKEASKIAETSDPIRGESQDPPPDESLKTAALSPDLANAGLPVDAEMEASGAEDEKAEESALQNDTKPDEQMASEMKDDPAAAESEQLEAAIDTAAAPSEAESSGELEVDPVAEDKKQPEADPEDAETSAETGQAGEAELPGSEVLEEIRAAIELAFGETDPLKGGLSVEQAKDGVIISITDQLEWSMFNIGSAVPRRDLVLAMEKLSQILSEQNGSIRLSGHTDARQFANNEFGNWQLSATRAQTAYHMLIRAGFDGNRVSQITGFADRRLKLPDDPNADANRRIEILLEVP